MKIWEGYLALEYRDGFFTRSGFAQMEGEFVKPNDIKKRYWVSEEYDIAYMDMQIDNSAGDLYIYQCFDRELSEKEQELLEIKMKVCLKEYLRKENEKMNKIYKNKMKAIKF